MKQIRILLLLSAAMIMAGCGSSNPTPSPNSTFTVFDVPPLVTATIAGVPSPVMSPLPTLSYPESLTTQELHQRLDPFSNPPDCALPCYNGLVMGTSDVYDVYNFYARLGIGVPDLIPGDFPAVQQSGKGRLGAWLTKTSDAMNADQMGLSAPQMAIFVENNTAQSLNLTWGYYPPYLTAQQVLDKMGQPSALNLAILFAENPPVYILTMIYPDRQMGFAFYGTTVQNGDSLQTCLTKDQVANTVMAIVKQGDVPLSTIRFNEYLLPLTATLGISYEDFSAVLASTGCFDVPASTWDKWKSIGGS